MTNSGVKYVNIEQRFTTIGKFLEWEFPQGGDFSISERGDWITDWQTHCWKIDILAKFAGAIPFIVLLNRNVSALLKPNLALRIRKTIYIVDFNDQ